MCKMWLYSVPCFSVLHVSNAYVIQFIVRRTRPQFFWELNIPFFCCCCSSLNLGISNGLCLSVVWVIVNLWNFTVEFNNNLFNYHKTCAYFNCLCYINEFSNGSQRNLNVFKKNKFHFFTIYIFWRDFNAIIFI